MHPADHCTSAAFFFNDPATTQIYTLSLHDALPILRGLQRVVLRRSDLLVAADARIVGAACKHQQDRKSTRLNSSHTVISYAVFCLKKKRCRHHRRHAPHISTTATPYA